ncbi:unnamed protein product [Cylicostephanus goldi]|uniref:Uncharacterized protein n=1 Tax=Cylicostephanus goldi TaxID=71465 RepID=A0A3P7PUZ9_CYLGO|nr:unnamed protein product [Cylicostephanus goldi]
MHLESTIYFYLVIRVLCVINCLVMLFCVALSSGWTSRIAAIIGLIFDLISIIFVGGSIGTLFVWDLANMSLPKRSLFMLVFMLTSIITGVMFFIAPGTCDSFNQYGCFQTYYSGAYKIAGAKVPLEIVIGLKVLRDIRPKYYVKPKVLMSHQFEKIRKSLRERICS